MYIIFLEIYLIFILCEKLNYKDCIIYVICCGNKCVCYVILWIVIDLFKDLYVFFFMYVLGVINRVFFIFCFVDGGFKILIVSVCI